MQKNGPQGVADFMRHPGRQPAEQGKVLQALRLLRQALAFRHFLLEGGGAVRHALLELRRHLRERGFGRPAGGQFGLRLLVEVRILEGHGCVGGQPDQDGFVPVGEGTTRGVGGVEQPLHPRRHPDRHGEDGEVPFGACPRQIVFAQAGIRGIVRRTPRPPGAQHLPPQPLARRDAQARRGHRRGADLIATDQRCPCRARAGPATRAHSHRAPVPR